MGIANCIEELKLHNILRYIISGSFSVISYFWFSSESLGELRGRLQKCWVIALLLSLLVGIAVYVIHRAILYVIFGRLSLFLAEKSQELCGKAILFGNILAVIMHKTPPRLDWTIILVFLVFLVNAFASNCRLWYHEIYLKKRPRRYSCY